MRNQTTLKQWPGIHEVFIKYLKINKLSAKVFLFYYLSCLPT